MKGVTTGSGAYAITLLNHYRSKDSVELRAWVGRVYEDEMTVEDMIALKQAEDNWDKGFSKM